MIVLHEPFLIEGIEVKESFPKRRLRARAIPGAVALERDIRRRAMVNYGLQVVARKIGFIRADLIQNGCIDNGYSAAYLPRDFITKMGEHIS